MRPLKLTFFSPCHSRCTLTKPFFLTLVSSFSSSSSSSIPKTSNPLLLDFLINSLHFSPTPALTIATRYSHLKTLDKPLAVLLFLQTLGFTQQQIQSCVRVNTRILTFNVDKILKPKIQYFQQLGLPSSLLGDFFSKSSLMTLSLHKNLVPSVEILQKILVNDESNHDLFKILRKDPWLICCNCDLRLLPNIRFLESCGIVGSQLSRLLMMQPRLFSMQQTALRNLVSKVNNMGFDMHSGLFAYALLSVSRVSDEKFEKKVESFERYGFSKDDYMEMVRKQPLLYSTSTKKSAIVLDFYLNTAKLRKEEIISTPTILMYSMEKRVMPRFKVLQIIKSKKLWKREPSIRKWLGVTEEVFLESFLYKFTDHREELLKAYKGHALDASSKDGMTAI